MVQEVIILKKIGTCSGFHGKDLKHSIIQKFLHGERRSQSYRVSVNLKLLKNNQKSQSSPCTLCRLAGESCISAQTEDVPVGSFEPVIET